MKRRANEQRHPARWRCGWTGLVLIIGALLVGETLMADPPRVGKPRAIPDLSSPRVSPGAGLILQAIVGGSPPWTLQWRHNGVDIPAATKRNLELRNIAPSDAGDYTLVVRNAEGEAESEAFTLEVDPRFRLVQPGEFGKAIAAAWADLNGDGWPDLVTGGPLRAGVFLNGRDGSLRLHGHLNLGPDSSNTLAAGDWDNDGLPDLVITENNSMILRIFRNRGGGLLAAHRTDGLGGLYAPATWVDLDGDGYLDLFLPVRTVASSRVLMNESGAGFRSWRQGDPGRQLLQIGPWVYTVAWGDYDDDGRLDVAVSGVQGSFSLLRATPSGDYAVVPELTRYDNGSYGHTEVVWVDYDNDGDLDLAVGAYDHETTWLLRNEGGVFRKLTAEEVGPLVSDSANTLGLAWGDYDNDGDLDLYVARDRAFSFDGTQNYFYENLGSGTFRREELGSPTTHENPNYMAQWVDYDHDGFLDLFVPAPEDAGLRAQTELYHNELPRLGNQNGWLKVRCEGRVTNRDGIGAVVRVTARIGGEDRWQMRQIVSSATGQPLLAHFGLGDAVRVDQLRVQWPSGMVQEYANLPINQSLVIKEPPRLVPSGSCGFEVKCWPGMQFTVEASLDLENWTPVGTVTHVNGVARFDDAVGAHGRCRFYRVVER